MPQPRQVQRQQQEHGHLGRECLRARHPDFGAGVQINAPLGLPGNRAAHGVHDGQCGMASALGFTQRAQRVCRLARLAEHKDQRLFLERRVAIAKLAGKLDLDRHMSQPLDQVLAHERRMPARAARREDDPPHSPQPGRADV